MDRYDKMRKTERNKLLEEYAECHPSVTLEEIGLIFGIKKQRVWELLRLAKERDKKVAAAPEKAAAGGRE